MVILNTLYITNHIYIFTFNRNILTIFEVAWSHFLQLQIRKSWDIFLNAIKFRICYLTKVAYKEKFSNVFTEYIIVFCKYEQISILMAATHPKKVGTETCLPLCHVTFPFNYTF